MPASPRPTSLQLPSLSIADQSLTLLQSADFAGLTGLQRLDLFSNQLTTLPAGLFTGLTNLRALYLSGNRLTTLPAGLFTGLTSLGLLFLIDNQLTTLPAGLFAGLTSLGLLFLIDNQLTTLPAGLFAGLTNLGSLSLINNRLTTLPASLFTGLTNLHGLYLNGNQLSTAAGGVVHGADQPGLAVSEEQPVGHTAHRPVRRADPACESAVSDWQPVGQCGARVLQLRGGVPVGGAHDAESRHCQTGDGGRAGPVPRRGADRADRPVHDECHDPIRATDAGAHRHADGHTGHADRPRHGLPRSARLAGRWRCPGMRWLECHYATGCAGIGLAGPQLQQLNAGVEVTAA